MIPSVYDIVLTRKGYTVPAILALALFGLCFFGGWLPGSRAQQEAAPLRELRLGGYSFINPLLEHSMAMATEALDDGELRPFKHKIERIIEVLKRRSSSVSHLSVFFREMNNSLSFGIAASEKFTPASLVKVPLLNESLIQ